MIFPPQLKKITLLAKNDDKKEIIRELHKQGVVHITTTQKHELLEDDTSLEGTNELSSALLTLNYIAEQTNTPRTKTLTKLPTPLLAVTEAKAFIKKYYEPLQELLSDQQELELELERTNTQLRTAQSIPFKLHEEPNKTTLVYKSKKPIQLQAKNAHIEQHKSDGEHWIAATINKEHAQALQEATQQTPLRRVDTSWLQTNLEETKKRLSNKQASLQAEIKATNQEIHGLLATEESTLQYLITSLENHYDAYTITNEFKKSKHFFVLTGYCEEQDIQPLRKALPEALITVQQADKNAPTKLKNNRLAEAFQPLTSLFSTPKNAAADPTMLMSFFYPLFFGLMIADIGYGLILLLLAIPLYIYLEPGKRWPVTILTLSASSAVLFGVVFGSFFGELIPITPLYTDAFSATMPLLYTSLALGAIHLNLGVLIKLIQGFRRENNPLKTIIQASPLLLIQAAAISYFLWTPIAGHVFTALTVAVLIHEKGVFGIMDISGLIGNWFSYARILAISLATSGVALATNVIAEQLLAVAAIGPLLYLLTLILGHTFNLVVSTIGAGINSVRLHYVEFFNLFFAGGGDAFTPFKRKNYQEVNTLWSISPAD